LEQHPLVLTGCPVGLWNYGVMRYLPVAEGNEWTYGCALPETVPDGKVLNENVLVKARITGVLSFDDHTVWQVQKEIRANANDEPALEDLFLVFHEGVLFGLNNLESVSDLETATGDPDISAPFLHESLRPRTVTDETDPLRQFYGADVR
jgi:hypothetical protein